MTEKSDTIENALKKIREYVEKITGEEPSEAEISRALSKYFTLREIAAHIEMERNEN